MTRRTVGIAVVFWAGASVLSAQERQSDAANGFALTPGTGFPSAAGDVALRRAWSPFGVTVGTDGHLLYDAVVTVTGLPTPAPGTAYVAWLATPSLDRIERLGTVTSGHPLGRRVDWNQLLVVVTREQEPVGDRWAGPTVLVGRSRSALLRPLWGHSIFRRVPF